MILQTCDWAHNVQCNPTTSTASDCASVTVEDDIDYPDNNAMNSDQTGMKSMNCQRLLVRTMCDLLSTNHFNEIF